MQCIILNMTFETMEKLHTSQRFWKNPRTPEWRWGNGHLLDSCRPSLWISQGAIQKLNGKLICNTSFPSLGCAVSFSWDCNLEPKMFPIYTWIKDPVTNHLLVETRWGNPSSPLWFCRVHHLMSSREAVISLVSAIFGSCVLSSQRWY